MTTATKETAQKSERKTITIDLTDEPKIWGYITAAAERDEHSRAVWVRRYLREGILELTKSEPA